MASCILGLDASEDPAVQEELASRRADTAVLQNAFCIREETIHAQLQSAFDALAEAHMSPPAWQVKVTVTRQLRDVSFVAVVAVFLFLVAVICRLCLLSYTLVCTCEPTLASGCSARSTTLCLMQVHHACRLACE